MKFTLNLFLILSMLFLSVRPQDNIDDDIDLDSLDINKPREKSKLLNSLFPNKDSKISRQKLMSILYKFLINQSADNIMIVESSFKSGKALTGKEEDLISNAHFVDEFVKENESIENQKEFNADFTAKLMNKETFSEFTVFFSENVLSKIKIDMNSELIDAGDHGDNMGKGEKAELDL